MAQIISVGKPRSFGNLPQDGACLKIHTHGLIMVLVCPYPKDQEIGYFGELPEYFKKVMVGYRFLLFILYFFMRYLSLFLLIPNRRAAIL